VGRVVCPVGFWRLWLGRLDDHRDDHDRTTGHQTPNLVL
jgi:hypothetical protein